jgi:hypothetical protein
MVYLTIVTWAARLLGAWTIYSGAGHTIAVLLQNNPYDRHLMYLLMIGTILFFSGFMELISSWGLKTKQWWAMAICTAGCVFVLLLTISLLPIFKAIGMLTLQAILLTLLVVSFFVKTSTDKNIG